MAGLLNDEIGSGAKISDLASLGVVDVAQLMTRLQGIHRRELVQLVAVLDASFNRLSGEVTKGCCYLWWCCVSRLMRLWPPGFLAKK